MGFGEKELFYGKRIITDTGSVKMCGGRHSRNIQPMSWRRKYGELLETGYFETNCMVLGLIRGGVGDSWKIGRPGVGICEDVVGCSVEKYRHLMRFIC